SVARSYVQLVADRLHEEVPQGFRILNLSRSGARLGDVLETQLPALASVPNSVIGGICTVGSNDLVRSGRLRQTRRRFTAVLESLPTGIVMATIPDAKSVTAKTMNRHLRSEAERLGQPIADVAAALTSWRGLMAGDGFHPNDAGHRLWARTITTALLEQRCAVRQIVAHNGEF
ncbi:MAG: SGNH/GDSL hydrolase family protein, partial [Acidimicrobiales bacterium]|nr:SGNH/GDSL hydrolase family protein [Acidimicrobiales bacterium]